MRGSLHAPTGRTAYQTQSEYRERDATRAAVAWLVYAAAVPWALWALSAPVVAVATLAAAVVAAHAATQAVALVRHREPNRTDRTRNRTVAAAPADD